MFVITGRREDVNMAKKEILSAAEHFSQIRARRNNTNATSVMVNNNNSQQQQVPIQSANQTTVNQQSTFSPTPSTSPSPLSSSSSSSTSSSSSSSTRLQDSNGPTPHNTDATQSSPPTQTTIATVTHTGSVQHHASTQSATSSPPNAGQVTIQVRVPYKVVGLVVGPKGTTIKRIQQQTQTYIITPSRERDPVFEITGQPDNVDAAKADIEAYIQTRMKSSFDEDDGELVDDYYLDSDLQLPPSTTSVLKSTLNDSTLDSFLNNNDDDQQDTQQQQHHHHQQQTNNNNNNNEANIHVVKNILDFNPLSIWSTAPGLNANGMFNSEPLINQNSLFNNIYRSTSSSSSSSSSSCSSSASVSLSSSTTNCNQNPLQSLLLRTSPSQMQQQQQQQQDYQQAQQHHQSLQLFDFTADAFLNDVNIVQQQQPSQQLQDPILFSDLINPTDASYMMQLMMSQVQGQQQQHHQHQHQQIPKCVMCNNNIGYETFDSETPALLLPCRHNMFCLNCAQTLVENMQPCPLCYSNVTQAIRIYS
jgi:RNA-binding protein MEX3